jgi:lipid-A-disaccharide synthase
MMPNTVPCAAPSSAPCGFPESFAASLPKPAAGDFLLIVAGEDSGDARGVCAVEAARSLGFEALGAGGALMQNAGLKPIVPFEDLAVSGFWDVLPRLPKLIYNSTKLKSYIINKLCKGLICVDYPGMNLKLMQCAKKIGKPIFYICPPQIWAWKPERGRLFQNVPVAVLFDFEKSAYEKCGAMVSMVPENNPPISAAARADTMERADTRVRPYHGCNGCDRCIILMPGSRIPQMKRNMDSYLRIARNAAAPVVFVASRETVLSEMQKILENEFPVILRSQIQSFAGAKLVVCPPGTASYEAWKGGAPVVVVSKIDILTYLLGKRKVKLPYYSLPNILSGKEVVKEYLFVRAMPAIPQFSLS